MKLKKPKLKFPRINMIIGKKQIIVAGLTLLLGAAIYVNYVYSASNRSLSNEPSVQVSEQDGASESSGYYGDAAFVSGGTISDNDDVRAYFAQARLDMQESRDEAKEFLQAMYNGGDARGDELAVIAGTAERLTSYIENETQVENLLKAQGFGDALCYLSDSGANIIVKVPEGLDAAGAAVIKSTLLSVASVPNENITIVEIN